MTTCIIQVDAFSLIGLISNDLQLAKPSTAINRKQRMGEILYDRYGATEFKFYQGDRTMLPGLRSYRLTFETSEQATYFALVSGIEYTIVEDNNA